jgi:L-lactate dehydrogenase complex protein LldG
MTEANDARTAVLQRIRAATRAATSGNAAQAWTEIPRNYAADADLSPSAILQRMEDRLLDYDAHVFHSEAAQIANTIGAALGRRGKRRIVIPAGLPGPWLPGGFEFVQDSGLEPQAVDQYDGVLTGATVAIADTGTIVLQNAPRQGRRAITLIPDYHLCVLFASQVVQSVPQAIRMLQPAATLPTTFISGPSATADIEMTRIKGVHGPRFLDVILVNSDSPPSGGSF